MEMKYAEYITQVEIDSLWSKTRHVCWKLNPKVNVLSGINGVGKSTIINKVLRSIGQRGGIDIDEQEGVKIEAFPKEATNIRFDVIRSFDRPLTSSEIFSNITDVILMSELDLQIYLLQRKYLDYQVNIGNRIIEALQSNSSDAAEQARRISENKTRFQDIIDELFKATKKSIIRTKNEIAFMQMGEELTPYKLSSGEKQMLIILLTVLVEDNQHYILFMDEPEASLHIDWQQNLIDNILALNPNVQIILTTHSPAVIMNGWVEQVTEASDIIVER